MKKYIVLFLIIFLFSCNSQDSIGNVLKNYDKNLELQNYYFGNFTNSGQKEVVAFYQELKTKQIEGESNFEIDKTYCFILNSSGDTINKVYNIPFETIKYTKLFTVDSIDFTKFGRKIDFGAIGDFTNDGYEKLFLYNLTGMSFYPEIYRFNGKEFMNILNFKMQANFLILKSIDVENKAFTFLGSGGNKEKIVKCKWSKDNKYFELVK